MERRMVESILKILEIQAVVAEAAGAALQTRRVGARHAQAGVDLIKRDAALLGWVPLATQVVVIDVKHADVHAQSYW